MADQVEPPERQAEEALREAARRIDAEQYPECSNGPDCQCPFHWTIRVHEADLRALGERRGMWCRVCGRTEPHGDRFHQYQVLPDGSSRLTPGPDATGQEPCWHRSPYTGPHYGPHLPIEEAALREHRRKIADGWHNGTCTGCGTEDEQVKGPEGAELCKWCDELRILAPAPVPAPPPEPESTYQDVARAVRAVLGVSLHVAGISTALTLTGCLLILSGQVQAGLAVWAAGVLYQFRR
jgi:hypothetical protein